MAKIKVKKEDLLKAITDARGMTTGICEILGITRPTLGRYIESDPAIREAIDFAKVRLIDRAEYQLGLAVEKGEAWAVQLALKNSKRGKERGYGDSVDLTSGGEKLNWKAFISDNTESDSK